MGDATLTDTPTLLARLEAALLRGEAAAVRLDQLARRHTTLDTEARATILALDRLIKANSSEANSSEANSSEANRSGG